MKKILLMLIPALSLLASSAPAVERTVLFEMFTNSG